jgi:broad specificity phosphatase PhoE
MTTVWLCRHAETAVPNVFHGYESDVDLSEHGRLQAAAAAEWFRELKPTAVVSSAMRRAVETAKVIAARCNVPHLFEEKLHERRVGVLGGTSYAHAHGPWAETERRWAAGESHFTTEGAESYTELADRLVPAFHRAIEFHKDGRIVVVAHGIVCKILLLSLLKHHGPRKWVEIGNCLNMSFSELEMHSDGSWIANTLLQVPPPVAALNQTRAEQEHSKNT